MGPHLAAELLMSRTRCRDCEISRTMTANIEAKYSWRHSSRLAERLLEVKMLKTRSRGTLRGRGVTRLGLVGNAHRFSISPRLLSINPV